MPVPIDELPPTIREQLSRNVYRDYAGDYGQPGGTLIRDPKTGKWDHSRNAPNNDPEFAKGMADVAPVDAGAEPSALAMPTEPDAGGAEFAVPPESMPPYRGGFHHENMQNQAATQVAWAKAYQSWQQAQAKQQLAEQQFSEKQRAAMAKAGADEEMRAEAKSKRLKSYYDQILKGEREEYGRAHPDEYNQNKPSFVGYVPDEAAAWDKARRQYQRFSPEGMKRLADYERYLQTKHLGLQDTELNPDEGDVSPEAGEKLEEQRSAKRAV